MATHPISNMSEVESGVTDGVVFSLPVSASISFIIKSVNRLFKKINIHTQEWRIKYLYSIPDIVLNINLSISMQFEQITKWDWFGFLLLFLVLEGYKSIYHI